MKKNMVLPNYENTLTNLACSIQKHFDLKYKHKTLDFIDEILQNNKSKNVIILVYDGLGENIINKNLDNNSLFKINPHFEITSVFPSTTAAATTSLITGLNPCEHGWVGWDVYIKKIDKIISIFTNLEKDKEAEEFDYNVANKYLPYDSIVDKININGRYEAYSIVPFGSNKYGNYDTMLDKIKELSEKNGKKYIYAYYNEPDHTMHRDGTDGKRTKEIVEIIDEKTKKMIEELEDFTLIVVADHGHIDCNVITLNDGYSDFVELLDKNIAIEGRAATFWVKKGREREFEKKFKGYFSNDFKLFTKKDVIEKKLFGNGKCQENFDASLGDYLAVAIGNKYFEYYYYEDEMVSHHAGLTAEEMLIPLFIFKG